MFEDLKDGPRCSNCDGDGTVPGEGHDCNTYSCSVCGGRGVTMKQISDLLFSILCELRQQKEKR